MEGEEGSCGWSGGRVKGGGAGWFAFWRFFLSTTTVPRQSTKQRNAHCGYGHHMPLPNDTSSDLGDGSHYNHTQQNV